MRFLAPLALCAALIGLCASPATATPARGLAASAPAGSDDGGLIMVVLAPPADLTVGSSRTWRVATTESYKAVDGEHTEANTQILRLTVERPRGGRTVISYAVVGYEGEADRTSDLFVKVTQAHPILFFADESGLPTGLVDWPGQQATLVKAFREAGGDDIAQTISGLQEGPAIMALIPEVRILGDMQSWPPWDGLRLDDPDRRAGDGDNAVILKSWREFRPIAGAACTIGVYRFTGLDPASPAAKAHGQVETLETTGVLSTADGWLVSAEEVHYRAREGLWHRKVVKVTRVTKNDTCPTS